MGVQEEARQQWGTKIGFIISAIGSAVGLGNIWRYPYVLYNNGGGTFLIPYFIAVFTAGIPILILEYVIGSKYRGAPPLAMARIKPGFEWIGWLPTFIAGFIVVYYSSILSWAGNYFMFSFSKAWGNDPESFFFNTFLKLSSGPLKLGGINMSILIGLVIVWSGAFLVCSKRVDRGIETLNKIMLPLMFGSMLLIVIRGITLPGAVDGLNALFSPDWSMLFNSKVWLAAYGQVFFSLSIAMGIMITFSSYLPKKSELVNTAFIAGLANSAFEFTVAIGVFGILGYMAQNQSVSVTEVARAGVGLAFIAFPTGINMMGNFGSLVGILFFMCLALAGFTSFISLLEAFSAPFIEKFNLTRKRMYIYSCGTGFVLSCLFATGAGMYILDICDFFLNNFGLVIVGILEAVAISWIIGLDSFKSAANENSYFKVGSWWILCLKVLVPLVLITSLIFTFYELLTSGYEGYPLVALIIYGALVMGVCFILTLAMPKIKWATPVDTNTDE